MLKRISCPEESDKYFVHEALSVSTQCMPCDKTENVTKIPVTRSVSVFKYPSDITFCCLNRSRSHLLDSICFLIITEVNLVRSRTKQCEDTWNGIGKQSHCFNFKVPYWLGSLWPESFVKNFSKLSLGD